jgi:hypothetical protein
VAGDWVGADSENPYTPKLLPCVAKLARFGRSPGSVVFGIEE